MGEGESSGAAAEGEGEEAAPLEFWGIVEHVPQVTATSTYVDEMTDAQGRKQLGEATPTGNINFALERYDAADNKCGLRIRTMVLPMKLQLAKGATSPSGNYILLTEEQKQDVVTHEKTHMEKYTKHLQLVNDKVKALDVAVRSLRAGEAQKKVVDALVAKLTPLLTTYLNSQIQLEKKRQFFHLDHLDEPIWEITNTQIRKHATRTYRDELTLADLQGAFDFLGNANTIDEAIQAINAKRLQTFQELTQILDTILAKIDTLKC